MVRNAVSMQNLRSNMGDPNQSSSQAGTLVDPSQSGHTLGSRQSMQLCGNDDHTKALMNRVATGQASDADLAEFDKRVRDTATQKHCFLPPSALPFRGPSKTQLADSGVAEDSKLSLQDYQMDLMLREQQHRRQLQMAGQLPPHLPYGPISPPSLPLGGSPRQRPVLADNPNNPALYDYNMQLYLLEQQNAKRKHLATYEQGMADGQQESLIMPKQSTPSPAVVEEMQSREMLRLLIQKERNCQGMILAEQTISRGMARRGHDQAESDEALESELKSSRERAKEYETQLKLLKQLEKERLETSRGREGRVEARSGVGISEESIQDYETQLKLLERQNKKRLELARQEQDRMGQAQRFEKESSADDTCFPKATRSAAEVYCKPFCDFLTDNPTVFHTVDSTKEQLKKAGWTELSERDAWDIKPSGRYFLERNGSSLIAFVVGDNYEPGNGAAIIAGHVDALTAKLKPVSEVPNKAGYLQLGVAPYAGGLNDTWWDRDLGIAGRVLVKEGDKIVTKLVKLDWPIARIPTLAPHFGAAAQGPFNKETQMTPIIGLEGVPSPILLKQAPTLAHVYASPSAAFVSKQPPALVRAIGSALGLTEQAFSNIVNWELELYDVQPATVGGLNKEFIYGGRIDDKLCSWAAMQALAGSSLHATRQSSIIKVVAWFDDEEIGSGLRQGARSNFLPQVLERAVGSLSKHSSSSDLLGRTYANSYILSSDVTHAVNPNFLSAYLDNHAPRLNTGLVVAADSNGHMTTDAVSTAILQRCADKVGAKLQVFQIRNDSRSGGTVGPMLSSMTGIRAIDAGMPQLSMHSIRATTGSLDPGLGVIMFTAFLNGFEHVDKEFR